MSNSKKNINWLIIGARRWARVMTEELCKITTDPVNVLCALHLSRTSPWEEMMTRYPNINLVDKIPPVHAASEVGIAIVVNSGYLHYSSIHSALGAGYNVTSEKPLSFCVKDTLSLMDFAKQKGVNLSCTNTFCFAGYFKDLQSNWLDGKKISQLEVYWSDPVDESRHGSAKRYDSSMPIVYDILPHIAAIAHSTTGATSVQSADIKVSKGGASVSLYYKTPNVVINAHLERNASERIRLIKYHSEDSVISFDFTHEPGQVSCDGSLPVNVSPNWEKQHKPIAVMFNALEKYFKNYETILDLRLSTDIALFGNHLIDSIAEQYVNQQIDRFNHYCGTPDQVHDTDFDYMIKEAQSLARRVVSYLPLDSPLRKIVDLYNSLSIPKEIKVKA